MERRQIRLEDGRYLIYYTFASAPPKGEQPATTATPPKVKRV